MHSRLDGCSLLWQNAHCFVPCIRSGFSPKLIAIGTIYNHITLYKNGESLIDGNGNACILDVRRI